jgi:hypothetical protein
MEPGAGQDGPSHAVMGYVKGGFVAICVAVLAVGCSSSSTHAESSVVTGFIEPCIGITPHRAPNRAPYSAGTVTALRGVERLVPVGPGEQHVVLPTDVTARQHVIQNQRYRFRLSPGRYVLTADYDHGGRTFLALYVPAGAQLHTNLPNLCK